MKKIDGKIVTYTKEIGAKWISDDGIEFTSEELCKKHENKIAIKNKIDKVYSEITKNKIFDEENLPLCYVFTVNSYEDLTSICATLRQSISNSIFIQKDITENLQFPRLIHLEITSYGEGGRTSFSFCDGKTKFSKLKTYYENYQKFIK